MMIEYLEAGANRHPSAADWYGNILAYGSDRNVALWDPQANDAAGVTTLLAGHTDTVNAVKFVRVYNDQVWIVSGSVDYTIRIWASTALQSQTPGSGADFKCLEILRQHENSVNCIAVSDDSRVLATGSADAKVVIWNIILTDGQPGIAVSQVLKLSPRYFPLAISLHTLPGANNSYALAVAGTATTVQLYVTDSSAAKGLGFELRATLSGHEGWIRSLTCTRETASPDSDLLLASASQDKYIRLWRIHNGKELPRAAAVSADAVFPLSIPGKTLSNKAHRFVAQGQDLSATFEALLLGHEDWIYSATWKTTGDSLQLLTASADNSLAIWERDAQSDIWISIARLGEISGQKGSTTATGSTGGFWKGLWAPNGEMVVSLGRTGSWRAWIRDRAQDRWSPCIGVGGHTQAVTGIAWSKLGDYLLSTSLDQTTRLHAEWKRDKRASWHEFGRPQIHGYDLNCIDSLGECQFVSGAEEKLLRVFNEPKAMAELLHRLCGIESPSLQDVPEAANIPVLGLSNKAVELVEDDAALEPSNPRDRDEIDPSSIIHKSTLVMDHPPLEDHLSRHTLWPEIEKLYGHGYEISALATSHDGIVIATACRASSIDHAVIRLFRASDWVEIKPPLTVHTLTVTRLRFSHDDSNLLSVGRDRQWAVFHRTEQYTYELQQSNPKGHSRMINDAAWAPSSRHVFATAGRDKQVKIWGRQADTATYECQSTISAETPVTCVDFTTSHGQESQAILAIGTDSGKISVHSINMNTYENAPLLVLDPGICPTKAITQLSWRPRQDRQDRQDAELAVASEDSSLRIYAILKS